MSKNPGSPLRLEFGLIVAANSTDSYADIRQAGISALGVNAWEGAPERASEIVSHIVNEAGRNNLKMDSVHAGWDILDGWRPRENSALLQRDVEFASRIGAGCVVIHYSIFAEPERLIVDENGRPHATLTVDRDLIEWAPMMGRIRERLAQFLDIASKYRVALAIETDGKNSERLLEFIDGTDPKACGICFDTGHAQINMGAAELARLLGRRVICTHIHDNRCVPSACEGGVRTFAEARRMHAIYSKEDAHLLPFEGVIAWPELLQVLWDSGYRGRFTYETGHAEELPPINARLRSLWEAAAGASSVAKHCGTKHIPIPAG